MGHVSRRSFLAWVGATVAAAAMPVGRQLGAASAGVSRRLVPGPLTVWVDVFTGRGPGRDESGWRKPTGTRLARIPVRGDLDASGLFRQAEASEVLAENSGTPGYCRLILDPDDPSTILGEASAGVLRGDVQFNSIITTAGCVTMTGGRMKGLTSRR